MSPETFKRIFNDQYLAYFPLLRDWCRQIPDFTKLAWAGLFREIEEQDLETAIYRTVNGYEPPIAWYERDQTASVLMRRANEARRQRLDEQHRQENRERIREQAGRRRPSGDAGGIERTMEQAGLGDWFRESQRRIAQRCEAEGVGDHDHARRVQIGREVGRQVSAEFLAQTARRS